MVPELDPKLDLATTTLAREFVRQGPGLAGLILVTALFLWFMEKTADREDARLVIRTNNTERMSIALERSAAALDRNTRAIEGLVRLQGARE